MNKEIIKDFMDKTHGKATITITPKNYKAIKKEYEKAVAEKKQSFFYKGNELLVDYAKYLLQFMEMRLAYRRDEETNYGKPY